MLLVKASMLTFMRMYGLNIGLSFLISPTSTTKVAWTDRWTNSYAYAN